jgi:hypothetical protein
VTRTFLAGLSEEAFLGFCLPLSHHALLALGGSFYLAFLASNALLGSLSLTLNMRPRGILDGTP